jgi:hypothetical protein
MLGVYGAGEDRGSLHELGELVRLRDVDDTGADLPRHPSTLDALGENVESAVTPDGVREFLHQAGR